MTGLSNRKMFHLYLQIELQKAKRHKSRFAVMCIGIDRMKEITEKYGLKQGDRYLIEMSRKISSTFRDGENVEMLIRNSEAAMYLAKKKGQNGYQLFNHQLHENLKKVKLKKEMSLAVKNGEFILYYQPIVDEEGQNCQIGSSHKVVVSGTWSYQPYRLYSIAEKNGLIVDIGYFGLSNLCRQVHDW